MRVAFITLYNQYAYGVRCLMAAARRAGHEPHLVHFKMFRSAPVSRDDPEERRRIEASGHMPVFEVHPFHDVACPYPTPVTPTERELLLAHLERIQPDIIGFSLNSSHLPLAHELSSEIRRRFPKTRQIWGGIHPTMDPEGCLKSADAVCVGEGDEALLEYLADPTRIDIRNFFYRDTRGGVIANPPRPLIQDLDSLPFPSYNENEVLIDSDRIQGFEELPEQDIADMIVLTSQRGCPFACTYCLHSVVRGMYKGEKYFRRMSVDRFLDEVEDRVRRFPLPPTLNFWDDILMIQPQWIEEFSEKYARRIGRPFGGYAHPNSTTRPILRSLRQAGCEYISIGVQSGSRYINKEIYNRPTRAERYIEFGREMTEEGYTNIVYDLLSRCPFEREEDLRATVDLLARMPRAVKVTVKHIVFFPFTPITQLDRPRVEVEPRIYRFYEMLYLLAGQPGFDPPLLASLVDDAHLRAHPEIVEQWVRQLARAGQEKQALEQRLRDAEARIPWGVKRAARHLADQVGNRLRRMA